LQDKLNGHIYLNALRERVIEELNLNKEDTAETLSF